MDKYVRYAKYWALRFGYNPKTGESVRFNGYLYNAFEENYKANEKYLDENIRDEYRRNKEMYERVHNDILTPNERRIFNNFLNMEEYNTLYKRLKAQNVNDKIILAIFNFKSGHLLMSQREALRLYNDLLRPLNDEEREIFNDNVVDIMINILASIYIDTYRAYIYGSRSSKRLILAMFHPDKCYTFTQFERDGKMIPHLTTFMRSYLPQKYEELFCDKSKELFRMYNI